ncbi:MAG: prepilin-type N-terminal cleavage/methylation domain-containing protein [Candidatus Dojkabacteria bacterium]
MFKRQTKPGFTLIEVLVVVALVAILAAITFIAINPAKNFADARNAQRSSDVAEILSAATQYTATQGNTVAGLGTITVCPTQTVLGSGAGNLDLTTPLVDGYIVGIPVDPSVGTAANTGYTICKTASGRITVTAPSAENGKVISVKR